jgi:methionyl-tRNA formyltransferase
MRVGFIGSVELSEKLLLSAAAVDAVDIVGVVTKLSGPENTDFCSLGSAAEKIGADVFFANNEDQRSQIHDWLDARQPDVIYCFGWNHLLPHDLLSLPELGVIGFHPTALPANRGRHPIIWALVLGLTETASTFFFMNAGADSGPILDQKKININDKDDARTLYDRIRDTAVQQVVTFSDSDFLRDFTRVEQDHTQATTWRKRSIIDGKIDWRMPAIGICNLVRALTHPYPGAHAFYNEGEFLIWRLQSNPECGQKNAEPGKVLAVTGKTITVACGDGTVDLLAHTLDPLPSTGSYIH